MDPMQAIARPRNCADPDAWEHYYAARVRGGFRHRNYKRSRGAPVSLQEAGEISEAFQSMPFHLPQLAADWKARGWTSVWVPGCGLSPVPKLLAHLGLTVSATDISETAVAFQGSVQNDVSVFDDCWAVGRGDGSLSCERHDLRCDYRAEAFDVILNVRAFQGFPEPDRSRVAQVHFRSLRSGRWAEFDTLNTWHMMDALCRALASVGFIVLPPGSGQSEWERAEQARACEGARIAAVHLSSG